MILTGTTGIDELKGTTGVDSLSGLAGDDTLIGGLGNDSLDGGSGADTYRFQRGDGKDILEDSSSDSSVDKLVFSGIGLTSTNVIVTRVGNSSDLLISFGGGITDSILLKSQLYGGFTTGYGIESITFSDGVVWTEAQLWNAYLTVAASSNDTLTGTNNNDTLRGGLGRDYLDGGNGADTYLFQKGDGQDVLEDSSTDASVDRLVFSGAGLTAANAVVTRLGSSDDLMIAFKGSSDSVVLKYQTYSNFTAGYGIESVTFSDGIVWTEAQLWNAYLTAAASSNDTVTGTNNNDTLRGGLGRDYLDGKSGADTYLFQKGDGQDVLEDSSTDASVDRLVFSGAGLTAANAVITRLGSSDDLMIAFKGSSDSVVLKYQTYSNFTAGYGIESVTFSDGVVWSEAQLWNAYLTAGASSNDTVTGTNNNDTLRGGLGRDYLDGKSGADTYLFQKGDGQDVLEDSSTDASVDRLVFSGAGLTAANAVVTRLGSSDDLMIAFKGLSDSVVLKYQTYSNFTAGYGIESVTFSDGIVWTEAQLWNAYLTAVASSNDTVTGTNGNDTLRGGLGRDYLDGKSGADTYLFQKGDGQDVLEDSSTDASVDRLVFSGAGLTAANAVVTRLGSSDDLIIAFKSSSDSVVLKYQTYSNFTVGYGIESVTFSDGIVWTEAQLWNAYLTAGASSNDTVTGTNNNDTLRGGLGRDYLDGKSGADTYLFQKGDGQDVLEDSSNDVSVDKLVFSGTGLTAANAVVTRLGTSDDVKISFKGTSDSVVLKYQLYGGLAGNYGIESITFSDGTVWNETQLRSVIGTPASLVLSGTAGNDSITGGVADDRLSGLDGLDTLKGGLGNDYLDGGQGADTYLFTLGDGGDTLADGGYDSSMDALTFSGAGLTSTNAIVTRIGTSNDLQIAFGGGLSDSVILKDQTYSSFASNYGVESVTFSDGVVWTEAQLWNAYLTQAAASDDKLVGSDTNNTLRGGLGNDYLDGGQGADTYLFTLGDGGDTLADGGYDSSVDALVFSGAGLTAANAIVTRIGTSNDLQIAFGGGLSDSVILKDQTYSSFASNYGIERVTFSDGVVWTEAQLWNAYLTQAVASDDKLVGSDTNNTLRGGLGNDYLDGGLGADTYLFTLGDGGDTLADGGYDSSVDALTFSGAGLTSTNAIVTRVGTSNDLQIAFGGGLSDSVLLKDQTYSSFASNYGIERVTFSDGVVWTEAQLWNAYLTQAAASDDKLVGSDTNNTLRGGLGNDYLDGGLGADTYLFTLGDGGDTLADGGYDSSVDALVFSGAGLTAANAIVTRIGTSNDLQIAFGGGLSDSVILKDQTYSSFASNYGIERVTFSDGVVWTEAQLWNAYLTQAVASDDKLVGSDTNNTLRGGLGNDYLDGGLGADTYLFTLGDGGDTLADGGYDSGVDTLVFSGAGLASTNVSVTRLGTSNDLQISFGMGLSDSIVLKDQLYGGVASNYGIESIRFSNGVTWNESQLLAAVR